jgi:hypothetical protein
MIELEYTFRVMYPDTEPCAVPDFVVKAIENNRKPKHANAQ